MVAVDAGDSSIAAVLATNASLDTKVEVGFKVDVGAAAEFVESA